MSLYNILPLQSIAYSWMKHHLYRNLINLLASLYGTCVIDVTTFLNCISNFLLCFFDNILTFS